MSAIAATEQTADPIRSHVELLHRLADGIEGKLVVSVYNALRKDDKIVTHHRVGDVEDMVAAIKAHTDTPHMNVFTGWHVMRRGLQRGKRGEESDIVATLGLVADMDSDTGKVGDLPSEPSMIIETSPGNGQAVWIFDRPLPPKEAKPLAKALQRATSSDSGTGDVTHVWRIPGTRNWPNQVKLARGRPAEPAAVTAFEPWDGSFTEVANFASTLAPWMREEQELRDVEIGEIPSVEGIEVSAEAAALLAGNEVGDRSAHAARVVERLGFDGRSPEEALALFLAASGNWFERYDGKDASADFRRLWSKHVQPRRDEAAKGAEISSGLLSKKKLKAANDNTPQKTERPTFPGVQTSAEFVAGFTPPDYHIDGVAQASFFYCLTGMTGTGKTAVLLLIAYCTALGKRLGDRDVRKGKVIYSAGENPVDVRMRWLGMAHELGFSPSNIDVHFVAGTYSIPHNVGEIEKAAKKIGGVDLVIVDTSAAYFQGDDENSNTEMGRHARDMRVLCELPGSPCVFAATHPVKNATADNLLPKGGGSFLNEVDGNLALAKTAAGARLHWQGKHRGPDFEPIQFELKAVTAPILVDSKGRPIPTVMASAMTANDARQAATTARRDEDDVLLTIERDGRLSLRDMAEALGWQKNGEPDKRRASTATEKLKREKLATYHRGLWKLTPAGESTATDVRTERHREKTAAASISRIIKAGAGGAK